MTKQEVNMQATAFFLSDGTGITVETLGHTLLSQFDLVKFKRVRRPYLSNINDIKKVITEINQCNTDNSSPTLVFSTLVAPESRALLHTCDATLFDLYDIFIEPMENKLGVKSSRQIGRSHGMGSFDGYQGRIDALNYTMANDDGINIKDYENADIIILGVSRSGKTPTCLFLALNYGVYAANYPLTMDDLDDENIPKSLQTSKDKLFGLTINPTRLHHIRQERKSNSRYAELSQCQYETRNIEALFQKHNVPFLDTSTMSIEEIATSILQIKQLKRRANE